MALAAKSWLTPGFLFLALVGSLSRTCTGGSLGGARLWASRSRRRVACSSCGRTDEKTAAAEVRWGYVTRVTGYVAVTVGLVLVCLRQS